MFEGVVGELGVVVCRSVTVTTGPIERNRAVTCLVSGCWLRVHAVGQVRWVAEHPGGGLVVVCGGHRGWLAGWWRRRWWCPKCSPIPAGPRPCELPREMDGEGAEAAVGVGVVVEGVTSGSPAWLLLDEGVRSQRGVGGTQGGVRGGSSVEVQDRSPLRGCADGQSRAAGAGPRWDRGQQGVQVTHI